MFAKELRELLVRIAHCELNIDAIRHLLYHLEYPQFGVPSIIAEVIAEQPQLGANNSKLPGRLAFGTVDKALGIYDAHLRSSIIRKLSRSLNQVRLQLYYLGLSSNLISAFYTRFARFEEAAIAAKDLAEEQREMSKVELAALAECVIAAALLQPVLTNCLLSRLVSQLGASQKQRLLNRYVLTLREGLANEPWEESSDTVELCDLSGPVRFHNTLKNDSFFEDAAHTVEKYLNEVCH